MGKINPENMLAFKSTQSMFDRISKRLSSYDAMNLIDTGDFHKLVADCVSSLGQGVLQECEAVVPIKDGKGKLPVNLKIWHAAFKCHSDRGSHTTQSVNEQQPWIFMYQTEISQFCPNTCKFEHKYDEANARIVIRTFVNGEESTSCYRNPVLLKLSPNVRKKDCSVDCPSIFGACEDEITVDNGYVYTKFKEDGVFLQYYGLPIDEDGLPMIPDNEHVEKAVEYYIYSQLFEEFYWNSTVPGVANFLQDARIQYDFHWKQAKYWANLPSFQKMINSVRKAKSRRQFFYSQFDRTRN